MHLGYFQGLKWDDVVNKNPDVSRGFDIFKITEGSDPDSRNQEIPVNSQLNLSRLKW
jgi:probable phosphoglycerate mutase